MTSTSPTFSVIIPCYNVAETVGATLEALSAQTSSDFEAITVNDGSTDRTGDVLADFGTDHVIRIIDQENRGLGGARNTAIRAARGEYLAFLDADDLWAPEKLERVHAVLAETGADLVCHDEHFVKEGRIIRTHSYGPRRKYLDLLFQGNCLSPSAVTVRRDLVEQVGLFSEDRRMHGIEDYDMWLRLAEAGAVIHYLHEPLGSFVIHGDNMSGEGDFAERERFVLEKHFEKLDPADRLHRRGMNRRWGLHHATVGWEHLKRAHLGRACRAFGHSFTHHPFGPKLWKYMVLGSVWVLWNWFRRLSSGGAGAPKGTAL